MCSNCIDKPLCAGRSTGGGVSAGCFTKGGQVTGGGAWAVSRGSPGTSGVRVGGPWDRDNFDTSARDLFAGRLPALLGAVLTVIWVLARLVTLVT